MECEHCGKAFEKRTALQRFCHWRCRVACYRSSDWKPAPTTLHRFVKLYNEGQRITDIARLCGNKRQYVSSVIARARRKGLVTSSRSSTPDSREER